MRKRTEPDRELEEALAAIRAEFPGWKLWISKTSAGNPGCFYATRIDPTVGIYPTVSGANAADLRAELKDQWRRAGRGEPRPADSVAPVPHAYGPAL